MTRSRKSKARKPETMGANTQKTDGCSLSLRNSHGADCVKGDQSITSENEPLKAAVISKNNTQEAVGTHGNADDNGNALDLQAGIEPKASHENRDGHRESNAPEANGEPAPKTAADMRFDTFPWNFFQAWPITREKRIEELRTLETYYKDTRQKFNVSAAIEFHARYPEEEVVPENRVFFQNGLVYHDEDDIPDDGGLIWIEGGPEGIYMNSSVQSQRFTPLGPASNSTEQTSWSCYGKPPGDFMYQLKLEVKILSTDGGTGQTFSLDASYDTGCRTMALPFAEAQTILAQGITADFQAVKVNTSGGEINAQNVRAYVRVMSNDRTKVVLDWRKTFCNLHESIAARLFRGRLADHRFVCEHPHRKELWVASSKYELYKKMPK